MFTDKISCCRNEPNVHEAKMVDNPDRWHGSELSVTILGNWQYYRSKIIKYLRQIAVITPYSHFTFTFKAEDASNDIHVVFARRTEKMPEPPKVRQLLCSTHWWCDVRQVLPAEAGHACMACPCLHRQPYDLPPLGQPFMKLYWAKSHFTDIMTAVQATKHHPKSVDLELVKQLIQKTKYNKLQQFLCKEFDAINAEHAGEQ